LIKQFHLRQRVFYFQGSGLDTEDLERVCLAKASGAIILANSQVDNYRLEDEHNTLRAWAFDQYAPNVPIFLETLLPQTAIVQEDLVTGVLCINEFKQVFLAYNTLYPGSGTLMINLLRGCKNYSHFEKVWHESYGDGVRNELFKEKMNNAFIGHTFSEISLYLFRQFQVVLFGLHVYLPKQRNHHVVLNPGKGYVLKPNDRLFIIAHSRDVVADIHDLTLVEFERSKFPVPRVQKSFQLVIPKSVRQHNSSETLNGTEDETFIGRPQAHNYKNPQCILLKKPAHLELVTVTHFELSNHVIIITNDFNVFRFICTLRLSSLMSHEIRPILVLCPRLPTSEEYSSFQSFPKLYFMIGDPHNSQHLNRANLFESYKIVLTNLSNSRSESEKMNASLYSSSSNQTRTGSHAAEMPDDSLADSSTM
jgi:hypothetical protein